MPGRLKAAALAAAVRPPEKLPSLGFRAWGLECLGV